VLRPRVSLAGELLMLAALAVVDIAESYGIDTGIKWPNDVQVNGKKLAGVIAESVSGPAGGSGEDHNTENNAVPVLDNRSSHITAVIGIGLNVNFVPADHAGTAPGSTSLAAELGRQINRSETFEKLVRSLNDHYSGITAGGSVIPAWRQKLTTLDRRVTVVSGEPGNTSELHGLAHDVDSSGRLIVRDENGRDWPVAAGEVTVREIE
ncbi:MAG: biotin--[acetyl-CoA-carboxylase] ligase, partial [Dehalococcoidia bacterium]|nr:biotin--[acetyl-CoA-carboxylase] ligase [Dehalococcoidia bacterium]